MSSPVKSPPKILFVDDEVPVLKALRRFGRSKKWLVEGVESGEEALRLLTEEPFDIIISDMRMPGMSGAEFLSEVKEKYPKTVRILLTGYADIQALEQAINTAGIFNYLSKPWDEFMLNEIVEQAHNFINSERERERLEVLSRTQNKKLVALARELDRKVKERKIEIDQALTLLQSVHEQTTKKFVESLKIFNQLFDRKQGRNIGHNKFVTDYAERLARKLGLSKVEIENTSIAASLHRVGALALPETIREKPQYKFTKEEQAIFSDVAVLGDMAVSKAPGLQEAGKLIRHQFEWVNGNGYPDKLTFREIPVPSQIISIVSVFYDVYNGRVVESMQGVDDAKSYIKEWTGKRFDTKLVAAFFEELESFDDSAYVGITLRVGDLTPGMTLDESIVSKKGILLLSESMELTTANIKTLKDYEEKYKEEFTILIQPELTEQGAA